MSREKSKRGPVASFFHFINKLIGTLLLLGLLAAAALLYFGSVRSPEDPNQLQLVYTKLGGYQDRFLEPGRFYILWEKLLPDNLYLYQIDNSPKDWVYQSSYELPSASQFRSLLPNSELDSSDQAFRYAIKFRLRYKVQEGALLQLIRSGAYNPQNTHEWYREVEARMQRLSQEYLSDELYKGQSSLNSEQLSKGLSQYLGQNLKELEITDLFVERYQSPDLELYRQVQASYQGLLNGLSDNLLAQSISTQNQVQQRSSTLDFVERLGSILERYPILISYFAVQNGQLSPKLQESLLVPSLSTPTAEPSPQQGLPPLLERTPAP